MTITTFLVQGLYNKEPLTSHYSSSVSGLVSRLLTTDPERRPSAREILEIITILEVPDSVTPTENKALSNLTEDLTNVSLNTNTTLLVTSAGPSAEHQGPRLGVYKKAGTHNNCPYYKQVDTVRTDGKEVVIYRNKKGGWAMGTGLDGTTSLENASNIESVPLTGWTCWDGDNKKDRDDPHLRISPDQPPACGEITITASGDAAVKQPECVGVYTPTQMFSAGRPVFKHQTQQGYLLVTPGTPCWSVQDSVESKGARKRMRSGCAPSMCPADPRARTSEWRGHTSWKYYGYRDWRHGDITVKCSVHKY